jgi:hypothetical protein
MAHTNLIQTGKLTTITSNGNQDGNRKDLSEEKAVDANGAGGGVKGLRNEARRQVHQQAELTHVRCSAAVS